MEMEMSQPLQTQMETLEANLPSQPMETGTSLEPEEEKTSSAKISMPLAGMIETLLFITDRPLSLKRI